MEREKVTREELRSFAVGESREFRLPTPQAVQSASQSASQMKDEGYTFSRDTKRRLEGIIVLTRIS